MSDADDDNPHQRTQIVADVALNADLGWLSDRLTAALDHVARPIIHVAVTIVDDGKMRHLNRTHRNVADTTDVLSFDCSGPGGPLEADIVVCADEALRRANEFNHSIEQELLLYALHGVLHLAGFDDRSDNDYEAMHAEEDRILTAIGVGPTFKGQRP